MLNTFVTYTLTVCISHCADTLGKGMNPTILPQAMVK